MARTKSLNFGKLNAELFDGDEAINPLLAVANITEITVNGKPVPASEAPIGDRIRALAKVNPIGNDAQPVSFALEANDALSKENESLKAESAKDQSTIASLTKENAQLRTDAETAKNALQKVEASNAELKVRLDAAIAEYTKASKALAEFNTELSKFCVDAGCLDLQLPDDALKPDKLAAAEKVSIPDKFKAYSGAVHSAVAKTGISVGQLPNQGVGNFSAAQAGLIAKLESITDPRERATFFKQHKDQIFAATRAMR